MHSILPCLYYPLSGTVWHGIGETWAVPVLSHQADCLTQLFHEVHVECNTFDSGGIPESAGLPMYENFKSIYGIYTFFLLVPTSVSHQLPCLTLRHKALADISQRSDRTTWLKAMISSISAYPPTSNLALSQCTIPVCKRVAVDTFHLSRELCAPMSYTAC